MPDWTPPLKMPRFEDKEMERKRAAYVEKHGYYVSLPALSDIIHLGTPPEPTDEEFKLWRKGDFRALGMARYSQITNLMESKKRRYAQALASPTPTFAKNAASILTFFDDWNDYLGTAGVVLRFASHFAPRVLGKMFLGPAGWLFLAADVAHLMMSLMALSSPIGVLQACVARKRYFESARSLNPWSRKSRAHKAKKLRKFLPGKGELIEMAQVTDQLWGVGLCLGPLMGFATDLFYGTYRAAKGEKVTWIRRPPAIRKYERKGILHIRHAQMMAQAGQLLSDEDHLWMMLSLNAAIQLTRPYLEMWNPLDNCEGLQYVELKAPSPQFESTRWLLRQEGILPGEAEGWTGLDKQYATYEELWDLNQGLAAKRLMEYAIRNRQNIVGAIGCQNAQEFGQTVMYLASD